MMCFNDGTNEKCKKQTLCRHCTLVRTVKQTLFMPIWQDFCFYCCYIVSAADLVIFLDINRFICMWSALKRHGKRRSDLPDYLEEKNEF